MLGNCLKCYGQGYIVDYAWGQKDIYQCPYCKGTGKSND